MVNEEARDECGRSNGTEMDGKRGFLEQRTHDRMALDRRSQDPQATSGMAPDTLAHRRNPRLRAQQLARNPSTNTEGALDRFKERNTVFLHHTIGAIDPSRPAVECL